MMVRKESEASRLQPRKPQKEPSKLSPSGWPLEAIFATNHLMASQYNPNCTKIINILRYWIPVRPTQMERAIAPKYHHSTVIDWPAKVRFGRSGTRTQETSHRQYMVTT